MKRKPITTDIRSRFGKRVRQLRTARGYSQEKLAELADVHWTYLGSIERGERNPALINLERLAKALDISLSELFAFDETPAKTLQKNSDDLTWRHSNQR